MFRLRGRHHLLTYADVDDTWTHLDLFTHLDQYSPVKRCVLAKELHASGAPHFHAYVEWERTLDRSLTDQLDFNGKHPNVNPKKYKKQQEAAAEYCRKDDDWIEYGDWDGEPEKENVIDLAESCDTYVEFIRQAYDQNIPAGYVSAAWKAIKADANKEEFLDGDEPWGGIIASPMLNDFQFDPGTHRTLVLVGPPLCGKTAWAIHRMPRPLLVLRHPDQLRQIKPGYHKSIVLDDFSLMGNRATGKGQWPVNAQKHFCDWDLTSVVHLRYSCAVMPRHLYKCFTCNPSEFPVDDGDPAVKRRVKVFQITDSD